MTEHKTLYDSIRATLPEHEAKDVISHIELSQKLEKAEAKLQVAENFIATLNAGEAWNVFMCDIPHSTEKIYGDTAQECYHNFKKWSKENE